MALTQDKLRKAIKDILKDADLDSLSAKKVRLQLQEQYDTDLSDKRKVIDQLVMELIEESQDSQENEDDPSSEEEELEDEPPKKKPKPTKKPQSQAVEVYKTIKKVLYKFKEDDDKETFLYLCRYLLCSMDSDDIKVCYIAVALKKEFVLSWIQQVKDINWKCCCYLRELKPENHVDFSVMMLLLRVLIVFTSTSTWKIVKSTPG
ncbi:UBE3B [Mytilus edulis]|uniref:UBE3B n=1 Tax=Mytilus edulis TaxID=6550 RepID=A0A8S3PPM9_MYTED|nr:UBE3B [Mytilus edulis]